MILVFGIPSEAPTRLAIEAAAAEGIECDVINQRATHQLDLVLDVRDGRVEGSLALDGGTRPLDAYAGVYARIMDVATLPEFRRLRPGDVAGALGRERAQAFLRSFLDWLELAPCRVASRPGAMSSNDSKPYQARLIEGCGLATPATLITNDPAEVRAFLDRHGHVVYKSISGVRSIVRELDTRGLRRLARVRLLPTQFQERIPGMDVRVHVAGDDVHATAIASSATDYRYGRAELKPHVLPDAVADRCRAVSRALELPLCGLDLRLEPSGRYVCFEANPMPAFAYYQLQTGQPIARSLVRYLAHGASRRELVEDHGNGARGRARPGAA